MHLSTWMDKPSFTSWHILGFLWAAATLNHGIIMGQTIYKLVQDFATIHSTSRKYMSLSIPNYLIVIKVRNYFKHILAKCRNRCPLYIFSEWNYAILRL